MSAIGSLLTPDLSANVLTGEAMASTGTLIFTVGAESVGSESGVTIISPNPDVDPGAGGGFSADWAVARATPVVIDISAPTSGGYQTLVCIYAGQATELVVYRRGAFRGDFAALSTVSIFGGRKRLTILPVGGWPSSDAISDMTWHVDAFDIGGVFT